MGRFQFGAFLSQNCDFEVRSRFHSGALLSQNCDFGVSSLFQFRALSTQNCDFGVRSSFQFRALLTLAILLVSWGNSPLWTLLTARDVRAQNCESRSKSMILVEFLIPAYSYGCYGPG